MAKLTAPTAMEPSSLHLPPHVNAEVHARIMADLQHMTTTEFIATLVQAGICTPDGELTEHYKEGFEESDASDAEE